VRYQLSRYKLDSINTLLLIVFESEVKQNMEDECGCGMHHGRHSGSCGCGMHGEGHGYRRRFLTKAEKTEKLKNYADELKNELKAVEEKISEMQSQK
jgi:hypothetical protein